MTESAAVTAFLEQSPDALHLRGDPGSPGKYPRVLVSVADVAALRACEVARGVKAPVVGVYVASASAALSLRPKPEWPRLVALRSNEAADGRGWITVLRFARPVAVAEVVAELGRQAVWPDRRGNEGLWVVGSEKVEADVLSATAYDGVGPLDERVLNPIGFLADAPDPVVDLAALDLSRGVTAGLVASLRSVSGVDVSWEVPEVESAVAGLAMAGVPLRSATEVPHGLRHLAPTLTARVDLTDPVAREEHSIELRRAALRSYSESSWRRRVADDVGIRVATEPSVSVVLATKRPEMLDHALAQIARQRGVDSLEVVVAPHGFELEAVRLPEASAVCSVTVLPQPESAVFGDVLAAAVEAASGDVVLKMDDDDWYSPDFIADLLLARRYSGAELVGCAAEYHYLTEQDLTIKRGHPAECYARFVAGGTMMIDRALLRAVGSFRSVPRWVDAQLLAAVLAAGGAVYRTHGLGYVLRRNPTGHTWEADLDFLLDPARVAASYRGFTPSRLLTLP